MKFLIIKNYTEVKDKRCNTHPNGKKLLREYKEPETFRIQYQVIIETQIRNNQEVIKDGDGHLQVKLTQRRIGSLKNEFLLPNAEAVINANRLNLVKDFFVKIVKFLIVNENIRLR